MNAFAAAGLRAKTLIHFARNRRIKTRCASLRSQAAHVVAIQHIDFASFTASHQHIRAGNQHCADGAKISIINVKIVVIVGCKPGRDGRRNWIGYVEFENAGAVVASAVGGGVPTAVCQRHIHIARTIGGNARAAHPNAAFAFIGRTRFGLRRGCPNHGASERGFIVAKQPTVIWIGIGIARKAHINRAAIERQ